MSSLSRPVGIDAQNLAAYLALPNVAACGGSRIAARQMVSEEKFMEIACMTEEAHPGTFAWDAFFDGAGWFHLSGITPALWLSAADLSLQAVLAAKERGIMVSCDYNYRGKLWKYGWFQRSGFTPMLIVIIFLFL